MLSAGLEHPKCCLPHFSCGAVNVLLAAATAISMRVVDKAFQLGQPLGKPSSGTKRFADWYSAEFGRSENGHLQLLGRGAKPVLTFALKAIFVCVRVCLFATK